MGSHDSRQARQVQLLVQAQLLEVVAQHPEHRGLLALQRRLGAHVVTPQQGFLAGEDIASPQRHSLRQKKTSPATGRRTKRMCFRRIESRPTLELGDFWTKSPTDTLMATRLIRRASGTLIPRPQNAEGLKEDRSAEQTRYSTWLAAVICPGEDKL